MELVGRRLEGLQLAAALAQDRDALRPRLERARSLIHAACDEPLDLDRLARASCLSRHHFARSFRAEFGETPHQYLLRRRIERAQLLLETTELSVTEICLEVGFSSLGTFSSRFSRHVGRSPSSYRRHWVQGAELRRAPAVPACFMMMLGGGLR